WVRPEHIKTFLRNCFIPNSTKKAVDPSLSTASTTALSAVVFSVPFLCTAMTAISRRKWGHLPGRDLGKKAYMPNRGKSSRTFGPVSLAPFD
ncbi:hypothetical protein, partial [Planifilum fimeticola]|uniref:hypothetical protein n=1 Tax=Planifilum fimeticola TaxID=201975 RepID=UPI001B8026CD